MSTWHQRKGGIPVLWHMTKWTVVEDPPNEMLSVTRFATHQEAKSYLEAVQSHGRTHCYILGPEKPDEKSS